MHMVLYPQQGNLVVYCHAGTMSIFQRTDWEAAKSNASPLSVLSHADGAALAWFLKYWLGDQALRPGYSMPGEVQAEFDF
jgi:hypothetical protein